MTQRDTLIVWLINNYPAYVKAMQETSHNNQSSISPYHGEGSVWTHTLMVMTVIDNYYQHQNTDKKILLTAALLHDIGKPSAFEQVDNKHKFKGHEGISAFMSIDILNKMLEQELITATERHTIFTLISLHGTNVNDYGHSLKELLELFRYADKYGAVRSVEEDINSQYDSRNFSKAPNLLSDNAGIMLVGLPCSGKSTYTAQLPDYDIVSRDDAIYDFLETTDISYNEAYKKVHANDEIRNKFEKYFNNRLSKLAKQSNVIVDMTMLSLSSRRKMMNQLGKRFWSCVVFLPSMTTINKRNAIRSSKEGKYIGPEVYLNMMKSFVTPVTEEGFAHVHYRFNENDTI